MNRANEPTYTRAERAYANPKRYDNPGPPPPDILITFRLPWFVICYLATLAPDLSASPVKLHQEVAHALSLLHRQGFSYLEAIHYDPGPDLFPDPNRFIGDP